MERKSLIELTNMCLVYDNDRILVQEKVGTMYSGGLVFPGGHIEAGESLTNSVIREIREETGLTIKNPQPCGYKDWIEDDGTRYLVLLYKTNQFEGELKASDEGRVFWLDKEDIPKANLIWNMRELLEIFETDKYSEFFFEVKKGYRPNKNNLLG
ncbi:MAG: 8-oxo-dGTP diphosphatase [Roseburia sp.]|nr:8-oxo-dGTP diphosphatase [Roseburia sp.]